MGRINRKGSEAVVDSNKAKQLSKEMASFCRQSMEQVQKPARSIVPQVLVVVLVALAVGISPNRGSFWEAEQST